MPQRSDQQLDVGVPARMGQLDAVAKREVLQVVGQVLGTRHRRLLHEHRNDGDVALERACRLESDEIIGVVQAPLAFSVGGAQPALADDGEQHAAGSDLLLDDAAKVAARLDSGDVHEDGIPAEALAQVLKQAAGVALGIIPAIADKDRAHRAPFGKATAFAASARRLRIVRGRARRIESVSRGHPRRSPLFVPVVETSIEACVQPGRIRRQAFRSGTPRRRLRWERSLIASRSRRFRRFALDAFGDRHQLQAGGHLDDRPARWLG